MDNARNVGSNAACPVAGGGEETDRIAACSTIANPDYGIIIRNNSMDFHICVYISSSCRWIRLSVRKGNGYWIAEVHIDCTWSHLQIGDV